MSCFHGCIFVVLLRILFSVHSQAVSISQFFPFSYFCKCCVDLRKYFTNDNNVLDFSALLFLLFSPAPILPTLVLNHWVSHLFQPLQWGHFSTLWPSDSSLSIFFPPSGIPRYIIYLQLSNRGTQNLVVNNNTIFTKFCFLRSRIQGGFVCWFRLKVPSEVALRYLSPNFSTGCYHHIAFSFLVLAMQDRALKDGNQTYHLISEVTSHHFCQFLRDEGQSVSPVHNQQGTEDMSTRVTLSAVCHNGTLSNQL